MHCTHEPALVLAEPWVWLFGFLILAAYLLLVHVVDTITQRES